MANKIKHCKNVWQKLYIYENNIDLGAYNGVILKYNDKVIECDKLIKDKLLEFALAVVLGRKCC